MERRDAVIATTLLDTQGDKAPREALVRIAESVNRSFMPIGAEHDPRVAPLGRVSSAFIRDRSDGESEVVAVLDIFEENDDLDDLSDSREIFLDTDRDSRITIAFDWTHRGDEDQADITSIANLLGTSPRYEVKKAAEPISIITLAIGFVAGGLAAGFLGQIGADAWGAIKKHLSEIFAREHLRKGEQLLKFSFLVKGEHSPIEVFAILSDPDSASIEVFLRNGLLKIEKVLPYYINHFPDLRRLVFEASGEEVNLLFAVRRDCRAFQSKVSVDDVLGLHSPLYLTVFKDSAPSFLQALSDGQIEHTTIDAKPGVVMASGTAVEIIQTVATSGAIATVLVAWLKARLSRKVILTTRDNEVIHIEGYSIKEIQTLLPLIKSGAVIDTDSTSN